MGDHVIAHIPPLRFHVLVAIGELQNCRLDILFDPCLADSCASGLLLLLQPSLSILPAMGVLDDMTLLLGYE